MQGFALWDGLIRSRGRCVRSDIVEHETNSSWYGMVYPGWLVGRPLLYEFVIAVGLIKPRVAEQIVVASYVYPCVCPYIQPFGSVISAP